MRSARVAATFGASLSWDQLSAELASRQFWPLGGTDPAVSHIAPRKVTRNSMAVEHQGRLPDRLRFSAELRSTLPL